MRQDEQSEVDVVVVERRHPRARAVHEQVRAGDGEPGQHVIALGDEVGPRRGGGVGEVRA